MQELIILMQLKKVVISTVGRNFNDISVVAYARFLASLEMTRF